MRLGKSGIGGKDGSTSVGRYGVLGKEDSTSIGRGWRYQVLMERTPQLLGEAGDIRNWQTGLHKYRERPEVSGIGREDSTGTGKGWVIRYWMERERLEISGTV